MTCDVFMTRGMSCNGNETRLRSIFKMDPCLAGRSPCTADMIYNSVSVWALRRGVETNRAPTSNTSLWAAMTISSKVKTTDSTLGRLIKFHSDSVGSEDEEGRGVASQR